MLGSKAQRLTDLGEAGFAVPPFVVFGTDDMTRDAASLSAHATSALRTARYAVRSAAIVEDSATSSMAGQFMTELDVTADELAAAIDRVRNDATRKLGSLTHFSMIVQTFIEPDFAGVTFTRNPTGGREMVVEYHAGRGDAVVSGAVTPITLTCARTQSFVTSPLPDFDAARKNFVAIEALFGAPQDIEWCIKGGTWYMLQSRPITTISMNDAASYAYLDAHLPTSPFLYEKNGATAVAPRPTLITCSLLEHLYADDGPIATAYHDFGVRYTDTKSLVLVGAELFVDRERELQSLFPSHSLLLRPGQPPVPVRLRGFVTSLRNARRLRKIQINLDEVTRDIRDRLAATLASTTLKDALRDFFDDYRHIFTINLAAEFALHHLERTLPSAIRVVDALRFGVGYHAPHVTPPSNLAGNTLELTDTSAFAFVLPTAFVPAPEGVPYDVIKSAQALMALRELGRWLALRHVNHIRTIAETIAPSHWAFHTIDELLSHDINVTRAAEREAARDAVAHLAFPPHLSSQPSTTDARKPLGVSPGITRGVLVDETTLSTTHEPRILVVRDLQPSLAQHFSTIVGVVAEHGGLLSHFAILAREAKLPVVTNVSLTQTPLGHTATIDGSTGMIDIEQV